MHNQDQITKGLNRQQREAVTFGEGPALVLAGPGSGKTTVIIKRILYLIQVKGVPPEEILVVTFTKEAAISMQKRFSAQTQRVYPVNFGTFHSIFYHILLSSRQFHVSQILTQAQKEKIILDILRCSDTDIMQVQAQNWLAAIGYYKNTQDIGRTCKLLDIEDEAYFIQVLDCYRKECRKLGGLDFDDMVYECNALFSRNVGLLKYWQNRFSYILIDEFQDINPIQYETIRLLGMKHCNIFAVGDEDQSIYGFRGSCPACIRRFAEEFHAKQILLNANYRSTAEIVAAADMVIGENKERFLRDKSSYAAGENAAITDSISFISFETRMQQLIYLRDRLKHGTEEKCAVLFRTNHDMQALSAMLDQSGIPYIMKEKSGKLYDHFVVKDILAYLKLAAGDNRREIFLRIMNRPQRGISRELLGACNTIDPTALKGKNADDNSGINKLGMQIRQLKNMTPSLAIRYICKAIGYEKYLRHRKDASEHLEEWLEILDFLKEDAKAYENVTELENAWKKAGKRTAGNINADLNGNAQIYLMTVHAAKGLEFDRVYIPDCNERTYPHGKMPDAETVEEERRIFFVAMTRAKKNLELLCVSGTKECPRQLSRFLNPIIHQLTHQTRSCQDTHQKHP